jgi:hypothetical protein
MGPKQFDQSVIQMSPEGPLMLYQPPSPEKVNSSVVGVAVRSLVRCDPPLCTGPLMVPSWNTELSCVRVVEVVPVVSVRLYETMLDPTFVEVHTPPLST